MSLLDRIHDALEAGGHRPKRSSDAVRARCPVHGGRDFDSLTVKAGDVREVIATCHSKGCTYREILDALGIEEQAEQPTELRSRTTRYEYTDAGGVPVHAQVRRMPGKRFHMEKWTGSTWEKGGVKTEDRVPYRLPEVVRAITDGEVVYIVEGEKDADALHHQGLTATTVAGGCKGWKGNRYAPFFKGADVVVIPDRDEPGQEFGSALQRDLADIASRVRRFDLPYPVTATGGRDVSDWLAEGNDPHTIVDLVEAAENQAAEAVRAELVIAGDELIEEYTTPPPTGVRIGMPAFDDVGGLQPGLWIVAGGTHSGKTTFCSQLVGEALDADDFGRVLVFSGEMRRAVFLDWSYCASSPCDWRSMPTPRPDRWLQRIRSSGIAFLRESGTVTSAEIARAIELTRPSLVVLDNMAKLRLQDRSENRQTEVQSIMNELQHLATEVPIVVACHLNRNPMSRAGGAVSMLDTRESASIENLSDVYLALQPDAAELERVQEEGGERLSVTAKVLKNRLNGQLGSYRLTLLRHERRFVKGGSSWQPRMK